MRTRTRLIAVPMLAMLSMIPVPASATKSSAIVRINVSSNGEQANATSGDAAVSADGRYIAFSSEASNLVPGDTNGTSDVFLRDRRTGQTSRISVSGTDNQTNSYSYGPSISADGSYVTFYSAASNLVPGDTNDASDVFLRDLRARTTERISESSTGNQGNSGSYWAEISPRGRHVAFTSAASNLVPGDTNGVADVFVRDLLTRSVQRISVSSANEQGDGESLQPSVSSDGRYVVFTTYATNLVPGDSNNASDVVVRDRRTATTTLVSVSNDGQQASLWSREPKISADGRYIVFTSEAPNLIPGDSNRADDIFLRDQRTGVLGQVTHSYSFSGQPSISADGRFTAFTSFGGDIVPGDANSTFDVFLYDRRSGATGRISSSYIDPETNGISALPVISADGRLVLFYSEASNLVPSDSNNLSDLFLWGRK